MPGWEGSVIWKTELDFKEFIYFEFWFTRMSKFVAIWLFLNCVYVKASYKYLDHSKSNHFNVNLDLPINNYLIHY